MPTGYPTRESAKLKPDQFLGDFLISFVDYTLENCDSCVINCASGTSNDCLQCLSSNKECSAVVPCAHCTESASDFDKELDCFYVDHSSHHRIGVGEIIGIVLGAIALIGIVFLIWYLVKHFKKNNSATEDAVDNSRFDYQ